MTSNLEVLFTPAEFGALKGRDLSQTVCVVIDALRATSSMLTAFANGATRIFPVKEIADALERKRTHPEALLAGERDGVLIKAWQTGSVDFDLGNSPREFGVERVSGMEIIMTTTNGTRALQACAGAGTVLVCAALNLGAVSRWIQLTRPQQLLIVCAGTYEEAAYEDTLVAGALCELLWPQFRSSQISDSAAIARNLYLTSGGDFIAAMEHSKNARRLLANEALRDDVEFAMARDVLNFTAEFHGAAVERI
ncbi:MAG TPA: 2-phosphosulfolactate phosphatase [Verrucomicrobiae bacterium]|jgi:2-phosphosulfolactate phosphatase|nr:2-phosphosulfolactate phosphatase [Verrucomicrobiae bacterium]